MQQYALVFNTRKTFDLTKTKFNISANVLYRLHLRAVNRTNPTLDNSLSAPRIVYTRHCKNCPLYMKVH